MNYLIKKIDKKEFEYNFLNCDTCKIFLNGFLMGRYNFTNDEYTPAVDDWSPVDSFSTLTQRQQKLVLLNANKYFLDIYCNELKNKTQAIFIPTDEDMQTYSYYRKQIDKIKRNISKMI